MVFKTNCIIRKAPGIKVAGFTLIEAVFGLGISSLLVFAVVGMSLHFARTFAIIANYADMQSGTVNAMDTLTKEIRESLSVSSYSSNQLTVINSTNATVAYSYSPTQKAVIRVQGTTTNILISQCESATFSVYQRTPVQGTFDCNPITGTNEAKAVFINWSSSRTVVGSKLTTDSAQIGRVVLRAN